MGRPRSFDEEQVLTAAGMIFWSKGYQATSLGDIAAETGVRPGSLHNCFGGKRALFVAAVEHYMRTTSYAQMLRGGSAAGIQAWLGGVFEAVAARASSKHHPSGCLVTNTLIELEGAEPELADWLRGHLAKSAEIVEHRLAQAKHRGEVSQDLDVAALADFVTTVLQGMLASARAGASASSLRRAGHQALAYVAQRTRAELH